MKRIFPAFAYGAGPRDGCWWDDTVAIPENPELVGDITCDVAIIGGGFTGVSAALHLAQAGASVVLLDANRVGWGASGRNGGFCCLGGSMASDAALDRQYGRDARLAWRQAEVAAVALVEELLSAHALDVDRHSAGETCVAHRQSEVAAYGAQIVAAQENYGVTPTLINRDQLHANGMSGPFFGAITTPVGFGLNPRKYLAGLIAAARVAGARVFDNSPAVRIEGGHVTTAAGAVRADRIIVATNGYSSEDIPEALAARYMPAQSTVLVTRQLTQAELAEQGWTSDQMAYDSRRLLHYFRLMPDRRFLFGMRGGLLASPRAEGRARAKVLRDFRRMFPVWSGVEITHSWSGLVCLSRRLVPFVGRLSETPRVLAGFAYHGNGLAMGTLSGRILAELALGQEPDVYPQIMQAPAWRFPLGSLRRLIMPPLYGAYHLGDLKP